MGFMRVDEWLARCSLAIGMDDKGDFFDLE